LLVSFTLLGLLWSILFIHASNAYEQDFESEFRNGSFWHNAAHSVFAKPAALFQPRNEEEIIRIIRAYPHVKVVGASHSFSSIAKVPEDGALINLDYMDRLVSVGKGSVNEDGVLAGMTVTVQAGMRVHQLHSILKPLGLTIAIRGSISRQSIAGAISTGTHGSSTRYGSMATLVKGLRIINGLGEVMVANENVNKDLFDAARTSFGALGVITEITLQVEEDFYLHAEEKTIPLDELGSVGMKPYHENEYYFYYWPPGSDFIRQMAWNRVPKSQLPSGFIYEVDRFMHSNKIRIFSLLATIPAKFPSLTKLFFNLVSFLLKMPEALAGESSFIFEVMVLPDYLFDFEYYVDDKDCQTAYAAVRDAIQRNDHAYGINGVVTLRYVAKDEIWLSPFYGRDSCAIDVFKSRSPETHGLLEFLDSIFIPFKDVRVHPGKRFMMRKELLATQYPKYRDFLKIREKMDPKGIFLNDFLRSYLGLEF